MPRPAPAGGAASGELRVLGRCLRPRPVRLLFQQLLLPALTVTRRLDVLHSPSFIMPMVRSRPRHLLTVYDMTFFSHPDCHERLRRSAPYRRAIVLSLRRADLVTCAVRVRGRRGAPLRAGGAAVAPEGGAAGIGGEFRPAPAVDVDRVRSGSTRPPYLLYLGTIEPRKNLVASSRPSRLSRRPANRGGPGARWQARLGLRAGPGRDPPQRVQWPHSPGRLRRQGGLPALLSGARLFVYPSLAEGFGFRRSRRWPAACRPSLPARPRLRRTSREPPSSYRPTTDPLSRRPSEGAARPRRAVGAAGAGA